MKHMKRFVALFAALALVLAMAAPAFADGGTTPTAATGSITIKNAIEGTTYTAYKIFDLDYVDATTTTKASYAYTADANWKAFVMGSGAGATYVDYNEKQGLLRLRTHSTKNRHPHLQRRHLHMQRTTVKLLA